MVRSYKIALWLGLAPLGVGLALMAAWLVTGWDVLTTLGLVTISAGFACAAIGAIYLIAGAKEQYQAYGRAGRYAVRIILLYVFDLVAAFGCMALGAHITVNTYRLNITNNAALPLSGAVVRGEGLRLDFGQIAPGESCERSVYNGRQRAVVFTGRLGDRAIEHSFTAPAEGWFGQHMRVTEDAVTVADLNVD